ncbi:hypothetical protein EGK75_03935 [Neisseria weixii]|uniref:Conjugal transfer protein TraM n=1 Tax=Neisseria weixii TaxID=1853276 RepID=A0A3N4MN71_9NEIS|nr:hypothetical protein [Neisseria weixii]RPD83097.1 hypothetical protein EGK74_13510 [Neisseria weixii]RPD89616.1 hypothetical protein EGK75_03935 [Neisseria weixii]
MAKQADDVEAIITDVFRVSGIKLTADDPIIAVLLVQEARLKALFEEQRIGIQQGLAEYAAEMDDALKETVAAAKELKTYREQILADLLAKSDGQLQDAGGRIYAAMQPKIAAQNKALADEIAAKTNRSWLVAALISLGVFFALLKFI